MARIFDIEHEVTRAARPRGTRDELSVPYGNLFRTVGAQFGPTMPPLVSDSLVLGLPAANRALNLIANGVASMAPPKVMDADGMTEIVPTPSVAARPFAAWTPFTFWHTAACVAMMHGKFVGLQADFDPTTGFPRQVIPLPSQLVYVRYNADGFLEFSFLGEQYSLLDVVYVPGMLMPGDPNGVGVVENFRRSMGAALEQQFMAADVYSRGAVPTGVLEVPIPNPDPVTVSETKEQWISNVGGQRVPAVIPQGWKFSPISWSPQDAQFLEARQFAIAEMAFMFGLDPTDLSASFAASGSTMTYANVEQREIARVTEAYGPWMLRFEQAWADLLPGGQSVAFQPDRVLRLDAKTRAEVHQLNIATGVETDDEARAADGKPPLTQAQRDARTPAPVAPPEGVIPGTDIKVTPPSVKE